MLKATCANGFDHQCPDVRNHNAIILPQKRLFQDPPDDFQLNWIACLEEDIVPPAEREKLEKANREKIEKEHLAWETKDKREAKRKYAELHEEFCRGVELTQKKVYTEDDLEALIE